MYSPIGKANMMKVIGDIKPKEAENDICLQISKNVSYEEEVKVQLPLISEDKLERELQAFPLSSFYIWVVNILLNFYFPGLQNVN